MRSSRACRSHKSPRRGGRAARYPPSGPAGVDALVQDFLERSAESTLVFAVGARLQRSQPRQFGWESYDICRSFNSDRR